MNKYSKCQSLERDGATRQGLQNALCLAVKAESPANASPFARNLPEAELLDQLLRSVQRDIQMPPHLWATVL